MTPLDRSLNAQAANDVNSDRRWSKRQLMHVPVTLVSEAGNTVHATVLNMADSGLKIALAPNERIELYSSYTIEVPSYFCVQCFAIWQEDNHAGLLLSLPVHPAVISGLARMFPSSRENV